MNAHPDASWNQVGHGDLRVVELHERRNAYVRSEQVVAVVALKDNGPSRLLFNGGGHLDVCGSADVLRLELRLADLLRLRVVEQSEETARRDEPSPRPEPSEPFPWGGGWKLW